MACGDACKRGGGAWNSVQGRACLCDTPVSMGVHVSYVPSLWEPQHLPPMGLSLPVDQAPSHKALMPMVAWSCTSTGDTRVCSHDNAGACLADAVAAP